MKSEIDPKKPLRLFLAVPVEQDILDTLVKAADRLRESRAPVRWVRPEGMHLTVKFLGDTDRGKVQPLIQGLSRECMGVEPFPISVIGIGAYPNLRRPRVIWAGVDEPSRTLLRLYEAVEDVCAPLGWEREKRKFSPHITVGRVKGNINMDRLAQAVGNMEEVLLGKQVVESLVLYSSELKPGGAVYETIHVFPLGKHGS